MNGFQLHRPLHSHSDVGKPHDNKWDKEPISRHNLARYRKKNKNSSIISVPVLLSAKPAWTAHINHITTSTSYYRP
jgi:hypothetical protein